VRWPRPPAATSSPGRRNGCTSQRERAQRRLRLHRRQGKPLHPAPVALQSGVPDAAFAARAGGDCSTCRATRSCCRRRRR
jgi:hypothetical protein